MSTALTVEQGLRHGEFAAKVLAEVERQKRLFPRTLSSHHEGYGVLLEEVDEYWDEVKKKASERVPSDVLTELVQIAAMCSRIAVELNVVQQASISEMQGYPADERHRCEEDCCLPK